MAGTDNSYNDYLAKVRGSESGGNQYAKNPRSTASGLYQFTERTWRGLGYDWKDRFNPTLQNEAMAKLTNSNSNYLKSRLGITPTDADLYGAHFLGPQGYASVYNKPDNTPLSSVLTPGAMSANPFLAGKTTGFLKDWLSKKMNVKVSPSEFSGDSYSYGVDTSLNLPMNTGEYQTAPEISETTSKEDLEAEQAKAELLEKQREKEFLAEVQDRQDQDSERRYQQEQQVPQQEAELDPSYYQVPQIELPNYEAIKYQQAQNQAQIPQEQYKDGGSIPQRYKNMGFTHVGQKKAGDGQKKWKVLAKKGDKYKVVQGGYRGMKDFSQHHSKKRQDNFWSRMGGRDSAKANDPFSPLYWHKRLGKWEDGGEIEGKVECTNCGWSWDKSESTEKDMYNCHKCGGKSTGRSVMKNGGQTDDDREMVNGIADILSQVDNQQNRAEIAKQMVKDFKNQDVVFDYEKFMEMSKLQNGGELLSQFQQGGEKKWLGNTLDKNGYITSETKGGNRISFTGNQRADEWINKQIDSGKFGFDPKTKGTFPLKKPVKGLSKEDQFIGTKQYHDLQAPQGFNNESQLAEIEKLPKWQQEVINDANESRRKNYIEGNMEEVVKHPLWSPGAFTPEGAAVMALQSGVKIVPDLYNKDYKSAAINSLGALPFVAQFTPEIKQGMKVLGNYGSDLIQTSKAAGKIKLPTYSNAYRWQADVVPESLVEAGKSLTAEQQALTGSWYTHDVNQLPFYMRTRPGSGNVNVSRLSDTKITNLRETMPTSAKGMSGKAESVASSNTSLPGELILPESLKSNVKKFKFDVNPSEYPLPDIEEKASKSMRFFKQSNEDFINSPYYNSLIEENSGNIVKPILEAQYQPIMGVPRKYFPFKEGGEAVEQFQQGGNFDPNSARDMWVQKTGMPWGEAKSLGYTDGSRESNIELLDQLRDKNFKIKSNKKMDTENDNEFFPQVPINPIWDRKPPVTKKSVTAPVRKAKKDIKKVDPLKLVMDFVTGNMGNTQNLQNGVITDKRSNTNYVVENGVVTKTFPVLTALNPDVNVNDKGVVYLDSHPESRGTPVGAYVMDPKDDIYGEPGFRINPIPAFGQPAPKAKDIALHVTYPGEFKQRNALYSQDADKRYASYGCVNCRKPDLKYLTDRFKKGDTTIVIDSKNRKDADFLGRKLFSRR